MDRVKAMRREAWRNLLFRVVELLALPVMRSYVWALSRQKASAARVVSTYGYDRIPDDGITAIVYLHADGVVVAER
jgi:hypothetical protein